MAKKLAPPEAYGTLVAPGWHMHLDILVARLTGEEPGAFWDGWRRLQKEYEERLLAAQDGDWEKRSDY